MYKPVLKITARLTQTAHQIAASRKVTLCESRWNTPRSSPSNTRTTPVKLAYSHQYSANGNSKFIAFTITMKSKLAQTSGPNAIPRLLRSLRVIRVIRGRGLRGLQEGENVLYRA